MQCLIHWIRYAIAENQPIPEIIILFINRGEKLLVEKIKNLVFRGAAFSSRTSLSLFPSENHRLCLIYGRNGTGKSTISKAFLKIAGKDFPEIMDASLEDYSGSAISYQDNEQTGKVFVFNEEYIQDKVKLKEDGLGTIVMFGKQVELEAQIANAQREYDIAADKRENVAATLEPFNDSTSIVSPSYYLSKMNVALSGDQNWAGRERLIAEGRRNASVNNSTYEAIVQNKPQKSNEEVKKEYKEQYELLCAARRGNAEISEVVNSGIEVPDNEIAARELLAQHIEKPELSERESFLLSLVSDGKIQQVEHMQAVFEDKQTVSCPFCLQPVSLEYKESIVYSIKKILSTIVEEHKAALFSLVIPTLEIDFTPYQKLDKAILEKCEIKLLSLNTAINILDQALLSKKDNPYSPIELEELEIKRKAEELMDALKELEAARTEYNRPFGNIPQLQRNLRKLNTFCAYYEIEEYYKTFLQQKEAKEKADADLSACVTAENEKKKVLEDLQMQRRSIKIAIDMINARLRYVFFSNRRLKIEQDGTGNAYILKSNGANVKPSDISVGERNILALCYFFIEILDNTEAEKAFSRESLVVIDDPISSFDHENRIGIMSLLRCDLEKLVLGNNKSRIVLMTHDLQAAFDLQKALDEITSTVKLQNSCQCNSGIFELKNQTLADFRYKKRHEYSELLSMVFNYGVSAPADVEETIGNVMRRMLEAFSTFTYKKGIDEISVSDEILESIKNKEYKEYFRNLMYRLVLNGESHSEERVRSLMNDNDFFEMLSTAEKQRTARDIVCFMYLLNPEHVRAHLSGVGVQNFEAKIERWCNDIKSFTSGM